VRKKISFSQTLSHEDACWGRLVCYYRGFPCREAVCCQNLLSVVSGVPYVQESSVKMFTDGRTFLTFFIQKTIRSVSEFSFYWDIILLVRSLFIYSLFR